MKYNASYRIRCTSLTHRERDVLNDTVKKYREAVSFIIQVVNNHFDCLMLQNGIMQNGCVECLIHKTTKIPQPKYEDFDTQFYKFPSYLRRAAISEALGHVKSWRSNYKNWEESGKKGKPPKLSFNHFSFPTMYKPQMFIYDLKKQKYKIKVFNNNDWVWMYITLKEGDLDYINRHTQDFKMSNPTLERKGKV